MIQNNYYYTFLILLLFPFHALNAASVNELSLGNEAFEKKRFTEALVHYHDVESEQGSTAILAYNKGVTFYRLKKYQAAENSLYRAINLDANIGFALLQLGLTQIKLDKLDVAKENFQKAIDLSSNSYAAYLSKNMLLKINTPKRYVD